MNDIDDQLCRLLELDPTIRPSCTVNDALRVAECLEARGYSFTLKDMARASLYDTLWQATFGRDGVEFTAENEQAPLAICTAATDALSRKQAV